MENSLFNVDYDWNEISEVILREKYDLSLIVKEKKDFSSSYSLMIHCMSQHLSADIKLDLQLRQLHINNLKSKAMDDSNEEDTRVYDLVHDGRGVAGLTWYVKIWNALTEESKKKWDGKLAKLKFHFDKKPPRWNTEPSFNYESLEIINREMRLEQRYFFQDVLNGFEKYLKKKEVATKSGARKVIVYDGKEEKHNRLELKFNISPMLYQLFWLERLESFRNRGKNKKKDFFSLYDENEIDKLLSYHGRVASVFKIDENTSSRVGVKASFRDTSNEKAFGYLEESRQKDMTIMCEDGKIVVKSSVIVLDPLTISYSKHKREIIFIFNRKTTRGGKLCIPMTS